MKLRNLKLTDATRMLEWMNKKDISDLFIFDNTKLSIFNTETFIKNSLLDSIYNKHYAVADQSDVYMGTISLKNIDYINMNGEYAIALHMDAIGRGYAEFATTEILNIAFLKLNLKKVFLNVLSINTRAIRFYEKYGFIIEGEFKNHIYKNEKLFDLKWYRLLREEFDSLKNQSTIIKNQ